MNQLTDDSLLVIRRQLRMKREGEGAFGNRVCNRKAPAPIAEFRFVIRGERNVIGAYRHFDSRLAHGRDDRGSVFDRFFREKHYVRLIRVTFALEREWWTTSCRREQTIVATRRFTPRGYYLLPPSELPGP